MTDDREFVHVGDHAESLSSGRSIGPGERVSADELGAEDAYLVEEGRLVDVADLQPTADEIAEAKSHEGDALKQRARDLDIQGRSKMNADELRAAVDAREAEIAAEQAAGTSGESEVPT
jgi:hypothetical protein